MTSHPLSDNTYYIFNNYFEQGDEHSPFLKASSRGWGGDTRLKASILSALLLTLAFVLHFFPQYSSVYFFLLIAVYFLAGIPALIESLENLFSLNITISVLMTLAAFSSALIGSALEGGLLLVLFELSGALEENVTHKAKGAISRLHRLAPSTASILQEDGTLLERSVKDININTLIRVQAGQLIPLDGKVTSGQSSVNLVHLTGENLPVSKAEGDDVPAGARNLDGALTIKVSRSNADSTVSRIIELVTQAQEAKPKLQQWFSRFSRRYAISIICIAFILAFFLPYMIQIPFLGDEGSIYRALAFLIAASPCALIIAIPIAYLSAVGSCARQGILLKGGITLDALDTCSIIAFDKTGTLTTGKLALINIEAISQENKIQETEAIAIAIALEQNAIHPIGKALSRYGKEQSILPASLKNFNSVAGSGLKGEIDSPNGRIDVAIGRFSFIKDRIEDEALPLIESRIKEAHENGEIITFLALGNEITLLRFRDKPREGISHTIQELHESKGLHLLMLTGDNKSSALRIAKDLGIDEVYADLHPEDKLNFVSKFAESKGLAMIGDGVNDAPALARATVGICMGQVGSSTAIDAADVVLLHDNLELLPWLFQKAKLTQRIVKQNLILALIAMFSAIILALSGVIPLWIAVILHEGSTVLVGLNGLRLLK
jgi:Cd2+/Zn2+-exporting ATPase